MIRSFLAAAILLVASPSLAATFTVTNTNTSGNGSLAKAIADANLTEAADTINFLIFSLTTVTINGPFPAITKPLTIDGYTQGAAEPNTASSGTNAVIRVQLDATSVPVGEALLEIDSGLVVIKGLSIKGIGAKRFGIRISSAPGVAIRGCFVGVNADGTTDGSSGVGIRVDGDVAVIGGTTLADRNLISGNDSSGIDVRASNVTILNNLIGTDRYAEEAVGNGTGILVSTAEAGVVTIGGSENYISGNDDDGIAVHSTTGGNVEIRRNRFFNNGGLAIDLGPNGVTANDPDDSDTGANSLQNYPVLTFARVDGGFLTLEGYLQGTAGTYGVDVYVAKEPDPSGFGEGERLIAEIELDGGGTAFFRWKIELDIGPFTLPIYVTATATNLDTEETSEFSRAIEVFNGGPELVVTNTNDSGPGSLRAAIAAANENASANTIVFDLPLPLQPIRPVSTLSVQQPTVIDGYTQDGAGVNTATLGTNAQLKVEIDGSLIPNGTPLLQFNAPLSVLRGLAVNSSPNVGVLFSGKVEGRVEGCFLGTDLTGTVDKGNGSFGVWAGPQMSGITIGGDQPHQRNLISGNRTGILLQGIGADVQGNIIGANATGALPLPNSFHGIEIAGEYASIGGDEVEGQAANLIRFNEQNGIRVDTTAQNVTVLGNSIVSNGFLGIELAEDSFAAVTPNDPNDADTGANDLQNFPELLSVETPPGQLQIEGSLDVPFDASQKLYTIRMFASESCDSYEHGEGEVFLGATDVMLSGDDEGFAFTLPISVNQGTSLTATATEDTTGNTSEFSECFLVGVDIPLCGDASLDGELLAGDALTVLKAAVGTGACDLCVCDVNHSGEVLSSDALLVLKVAVGQPIELDCPLCF